MARSPDYPLLFEPMFKRRIWGGRRLQGVLGKKLPGSEPIGESWELCDLADESSVVANGPLSGVALQELMSEFGCKLLGPSCVAALERAATGSERFPLLIKWLDATEKLSIQVHPPDGHPCLPPEQSGKSECWFVLDAEPNAEVHLGLRRGVDRPMLLHELHRGTLDRCLNARPARPGDCYFVPAGAVHSLGGGVLLAEIQQSSDVTFRLFDWNRLDPTTGRPRHLHVDAALACIDFQWHPCDPVNVAPRGDAPAEQVLLRAEQCRYFVVTWRQVQNEIPLGEAGRFHVLVVLEGSGVIGGAAGQDAPVVAGDVVLLPAAGPFQLRLSQPLRLLDVSVPDIQEQQS